MFEVYRAKYPELSESFDVGEKVARDGSVSRIWIPMVGIEFYLSLSSSSRGDITRIRDELITATAFSLERRIEKNSADGVAQTLQDNHSWNRGLQEILIQDVPQVMGLSRYGEESQAKVREKLRKGVSDVISALSDMYLKAAEQENIMSNGDALLDINIEQDLRTINSIVRQTGVDVKSELANLGYAAARIYYRKALARVELPDYVEWLNKNSIAPIVRIGSLSAIDCTRVIRALIEEAAEKYAVWHMRYSNANSDFFEKHFEPELRAFKALAAAYGTNVDEKIKTLVIAHIEALRDSSLSLIGAGGKYYFDYAHDRAVQAMTRIVTLGVAYKIKPEADSAVKAISNAMVSSRFIRLRDLEEFGFRLGFEGE